MSLTALALLPGLIKRLWGKMISLELIIRKQEMLICRIYGNIML